MLTKTSLAKRLNDLDPRVVIYDLGMYLKKLPPDGARIHRTVGTSTWLSFPYDRVRRDKITTFREHREKYPTQYGRVRDAILESIEKDGFRF